MAHHQGPDDQERIEQTREEIRNLQAECLRLKDLTQKEKRDEDSRKDELTLARQDLAKVEDELSRERARLGKEQETQETLQGKAKSYYIENEVDKLLKERVPMMSASAEEEDEGDAQQDAGGGLLEEEGKDKQDKVHDTVLISYVRVDKPGEDYKVAYRIGPGTTVEQLHRDACAYWGCSHREYFLYKIEKDKPEMLSSAENQKGEAPKLQSEEILSPSETAHLHLLREEDVAKFEDILTKKKIEELRAEAKEQPADGKPALKTMKHGPFAVKEAISEPWIEALKPWPGLQELLNKNIKRTDRKWKLVKLSDYIGFLVLIVLSLICVQLQGSDHWMICNGVVQTLSRGVSGETSNGKVMAFDALNLYDDIWPWVGGSFHYQVFNTNSTLRQMYSPVGYMRLRQQLAAPTTCPDRNIPDYLQWPCYEILVDEGQDADLSGSNPQQVKLMSGFLNKSHPGRLQVPNPFQWQREGVDPAVLYGELQDYNSAGYSVVYEMTPAGGATFLSDLDFIRQSWVGPNTRMLVLELTLSNPSLAGYVSARFMVEVSTSGSVNTVVDVLPFRLSRMDTDRAEDALTGIRWALVIGYMLLIRGCAGMSEMSTLGRWRLAYFRSFGSLLEVSAAGVFIAVQAARREATPMSPVTLPAFWSYHAFARRQAACQLGEACFLLLLLVRFATFGRMVPTIYRFFKTFWPTLQMFGYFCVLFLPALVGSAMLAHSIWSPYVLRFSNYTQAIMTVMLAVQHSFTDVMTMNETGNWWTIPFLIFFFFSTTAFMLNIFVAITVHAYFEVELVEGSQPVKDVWSTWQWLDWALWAPVFERVSGGRKSGISRITGYRESDEVDSDDAEDEDDDDDEDK